MDRESPSTGFTKTRRIGRQETKGINQAANFQETRRNIEERVEVWKIDAGDESLNSKSHRRYRCSRKPAKTAGAILIC
jgi:hypothetical protein